jgi:hypothetical protein
LAEQPAIPLRALIERLQIKTDPELTRVEALALKIQEYRRDAAAQGDVSRSSILHACGLIQPTVFSRLSQAGFNRAAWDQVIQVQEVRFEIPTRPVDTPLTVPVRPDDVTPVLERYAEAFQRRPLDALGLAWAIAATPPEEGVVGHRLQRAGLNRDTADALLAEDVAATIGLVSISGLDRYRVTPAVSGALEKAKAHARERGPGTPLTASLLLLGLIEQGGDSSVDDTAALLWNKLRGDDPSRFDSIVEEYLSWYGEQQLRDTAVRWMTRRVGEIFERARNLSVSARRRNLINARSLLGAILAYRTPEGSTTLGAHLLLERLGWSVEAMTAELLDYLRTNAPTEGGDNLEAWEEFFRSAEDQESGPANVARIDAESLGGKDLLRIDSDVKAFALLLASANLTPPLAIGLFGNWGAGKSFFMKKLFESIDGIARKAEKQRSRNIPTPFHGQIVQIELNAWHYEETNLWASMVTHIFESLHRHFEPRKDEEKEQWAELLKKLSEASLSQDGARNALAQAEEDLKQAHQKHEAKKAKLKTVVDATWKTIKASLGQKEQKALEEALGAPQLEALKEDLLLHRKEALELWDRVALQRQAVVRMIGKPSTLWLPAVVLALSLAILAVLPSLLPLLKAETAQRALATVTEVFAFIGGISAWIGSALRKASGVLGTLDKLQTTVRKQIEGTETAQKLRAAEADVTLARQRLEEQQVQVATLRAEIELLRPGQRLLRFLEDRAGSSDYRKHLGLPALVRRDFEQLQKLLNQELLLERTAAEQALDSRGIPEALKDEIKKFDLPLDDKAPVRIDEAGWRWTIDEPSNNRRFEIERPAVDSGKLRCRVVWTNLPRIDRIILYIDDLDRCPPDRVVEVLRAIQLLLSFPLFVVVVGVDARWVKRSLNVRYRNQLRSSKDGGWDGATPQDYIEKIFQIPFWLEPLSPGSTRRYLEGLLAASPAPARRGVPTTVTEGGGQADSGAAAETSETERDAAAAKSSEDAASTAASSTPSTPAASQAVSSAEPEDEPLPDLLEIEPLEQDFMLELAPLVRRTPRSVKRFVNIYRLFRASQAKGRLNAFLGTEDIPGPYREALVLLGLLTAAPEIAPQVFSYLSLAPGTTLEDALDAKDPMAPPFSSPAWSVIENDLRCVIENLAGAEAPPLRLDAMREHLREAARYSFLEMPPL